MTERVNTKPEVNACLWRCYMRAMDAVILQHEEHEGPGLFGPALDAQGFRRVLRYRSARYEDVDAALLVVLGGPMSVLDHALHPFLNEERAVLAERLARGRPCLGLCLGAQLMAAAAGVEVFPGKNGFEAGVTPVRWTREAQVDPVIAGVRPKTPVAHWHRDTFQPIPGATLLASTDRYTQQAFRLGDSYGFQFHLELTAEELDRWLASERATLEEQGQNPEALRATLPKLKAAEPELKALVTRLAEHFAAAARRTSA